MNGSIIVHGGAGGFISEADSAVATAGCRAAARAGYQVLAAGGTALDAVVAAVVVLEDDPHFNAGTGSVLNVDGEIEMDASVMEGGAGLAGAVALVRTVKNPVLLARMVMERTPHLLLAGDGAESFAREHGVLPVEPEALITATARLKWTQGRATKHGTVGAVAFDGAHVAAATSTGGTAMKRRGRIGDSPLIGCGTYARDGAGAASCTGLGESIIRSVLAKSAVDLVRQGEPPMAAAGRALLLLVEMGGDGGLILVDGQGQLGAAFNTARMAHAWVNARGQEGSACSTPGTMD